MGKKVDRDKLFFEEVAPVIENDGFDYAFMEHLGQIEFDPKLGALVETWRIARKNVAEYIRRNYDQYFEV